MARRAVALMCVLVGCTGNGDKTGPSLTTLDSLTDVCAGDPDLPTVTGDVLLSVLQPAYTATYTASFPYAEAPSSVALSFAYAGGTILCGSPGYLVGDIASFVELDMNGQFATADGVFNESLTARVHLDQQGVMIWQLSFRALELSTNVHGTLDVAQGGPPGDWTFQQLEYNGVMYPPGMGSGSSTTSGNLALYSEQDAPSAQDESAANTAMGTWQ